MDILRDDSGVVRNPSFHDGRFLGLVISPDKRQLTIYCQTVDGLQYEITAPGLVRLRADNILEGNIIFDLAVHEGGTISADAVKKLWRYDETTAETF